MNAEDQTTFSRANPSFNRQPPSLISKVLAFVVGTGFLVLAFMFSLVALAVIVLAGLGLWGWLWWKTRAIRQQMRQQMNEPAATASAAHDGLIIEGEVIREASSAQQSERLLRQGNTD